MKDDFYIGWSDQNSNEFKRWKKRIFWSLVAGIGVLLIGFTLLEDPFIESRFEYGTLTTLEGDLVDYPVLGLRTEIDGEKKTVPLVGFGKAGPENSFIGRDIKSLTTKKITLQGTLIRYRDKVWMELTEGPNSILDIHEGETDPFQIRKMGEVNISGEIVDPKCFFGVMNPAFKKIHRSCAIRCLSGGIPPVLAVRENGKFIDYYFLIHENGSIPELAHNAGIPVIVNGFLEEVNDWKVIKIQTFNRSLTFPANLDSTITLCNS